MRRTAKQRALDGRIAGLAFPALGALIAEPLYVLTDTAIVGRIGTTELGGLAVASTILVGGASVFVFLAYATTSQVARSRGSGNTNAAVSQGVAALWLAAGIGIVLAVAGWAGSGPAVRAIGAEPSVSRAALTYLRISLPGVPFLLMSLAGAGFLRGLADTRTTLVVAALGVVANLVLEVVAVYGLDLGLAGSAASTVVAQVGVAVAYGVLVYRRAADAGVGRVPTGAEVSALARISGSLLVRTIALRASLALATALAARRGTVALAAHQVTFEVWSALALALDALAIAAQALVAERLGAGDVGGARAAATRALNWGLGAGVVSAVVLLPLATVVAGVFTSDPEVTRLAATLLVVAAVLQPLAGVVFVLDGILMGAGDMKFLAWAMAASGVVFVLAAMATERWGLDVRWVWWSIGAFMGARAVGLVCRFLQGGWVLPSRPAAAGTPRGH
ncbi:MAG: MATE family efflux transporter [Acidimicrobiales bacterium]